MSVSTAHGGGRRADTADAGRDRQRNRNERGVRSARQVPPRAGEKLPSPPRERRPAMAALAVLLIVGGAAVAGLLALRSDSRVDMLVAGRDISVGQEITREDLASVRVSSDGLDLIPADQLGTVVGGYAVQNIPAGRALELRMLASEGLFTDGEVGVGVSIAAGRAPTLRPGDYVQVVRVVDGESTVLVERAMVYSVAGGAGGSDSLAGEAASTTEDGGAELVMSAAQAPEVVAANAADELSFVLVESGS